MLNKTIFDKNFNKLLILKSVMVNEAANSIWYGELKNNFSDDEFIEVCNDILRTENLFGKYPDVKLFYDRKKEQDNFLTEDVCDKFLNKVCDYLNDNFFGDIKEFKKSFNEFENRVLNSQGGLSNLYEATHNDFKNKSVGYILKDLREFYLNNINKEKRKSLNIIFENKKALSSEKTLLLESDNFEPDEDGVIHDF